MKSSLLFPSTLALLTPSNLYCAVITFEDFEDATIGYSTSVADDLSDISNGDYFGRIASDTAPPPAGVVYANPQGTGYYGAQDMDGANSGNIDALEINFPGITITGYLGLTFSALFAEDSSNDGLEDWDGNSSVRVSYQIDGGGFATVLAFEGEGSGFNTAPRLDTNLDGLGDDAALTDTFTVFGANLSGTGDLLDLRITIENISDGDEDIAIDNVLISGTIPEPSSTLLGSLALLFLLRRER